MGESERSKAGREMFNSIKDYRSPNTSADIFGAMDKQVGVGTGIIRKNAATDIARKTSGLGGSLRSRGISKGSIFDETISGGTEGIRSDAANSVDRLNLGRLSAVPGVLSQENEMDFKKLFARLQSVGLLDDTTTADDIFAALNAAGNVAKGVGSMATGGLFGGKNSLWS